ncbi:MAG: BsuBI/PstI family type II restriction endonuclease [Treponema sp.]|nr:BsuBI/PstI family type II restriction endonuclease [Treponema sp.]
MKIEEQRKQKINEAVELLKFFGMPIEQQNERTAYCLLSLLNVTPEKEWKNAEKPLVGITPMMNFAREYYEKEYAPNTRETFRRFSIHQLVQAGIVLYNSDNPNRPVNSPKAVYQISSAALKVIKSYKTDDFESLLKQFHENQKSLAEQYAHEREMNMVSVKIRENHSVQISPGKHSELIRDIIEQMAPRFLPESTLVYIGDTGEKWGYYDQELAGKLLFNVQQHGKMPDVILYVESKNWLVLVESVTSHGPVDSKRYIELEELFSSVTADKVYISAFPDKKTFTRFAQDIAWETEAWISDNPSHMIHFNGDKFLGPHKG